MLCLAILRSRLAQSKFQRANGTSVTCELHWHSCGRRSRSSGSSALRSCCTSGRPRTARQTGCRACRSTACRRRAPRASSKAPASPARASRSPLSTLPSPCCCASPSRATRPRAEETRGRGGENANPVKRQGPAQSAWDGSGGRLRQQYMLSPLPAIPIRQQERRELLGARPSALYLRAPF